MLTWTILAAANFAGALLSYAFLAHALARLCWSGRGILLILIAIIISAQVWFIPQLISAFVFHENLILDWVWFLDWLCCCFSIVVLWNVLRDTSPDHASAAGIDGCGAFGIYWHVVLPLVRLALLLLGILILIASGGYVVARPSEIFRAEINSANWTYLAATYAGMTVAPIGVFLLARKLFPPRKF
jgi:putative chitobiose transport system permease protein